MDTTTQAPMVRSMKDLIGYPIEAEDGNIGEVDDFLFDDEKLTIRYLVADTGAWLSSHKVLISPYHLKEPDLDRIGTSFPVALTKERIEACPPLKSNKPISRQYEDAFSRHYGHAPYWTGSLLWGFEGAPVAPQAIVVDPEPPSDAVVNSIKGTHLRSFNEIRKYDVGASDGDIGNIDDIIIETGSWKLRYIIVDTNGWLPGGKVMLAVDWLDGFDCTGEIAGVDLTKEQIKAAPAFDPNEAANVDFQMRLYNYYGKPVDWAEPAATPF